MSSFQKVENAVRRATELQSAGNPHEALQYLHDILIRDSFKASGWNPIKEQFMIIFINLCLELDKLKYVRDGLYQYRTISHQLNIPSLGKVITQLRDKSEEKFRAAKAHYGGRTVQIVADLDAEESPEELMLNTIQLEVRDSAGRIFHNALRFLWETYKVILDVLKFSPKLHKVYHDTARRACNFCLENQRAVEFKRLCDITRHNYSSLFKYRNNKENEILMRPEVNLETRLTQLNVATELGFWKEAFNTAEDLCNLGIHDLFFKSFRNLTESNKLRENLLKWMAIYYEKLAKIFWVSENYLFHALAYLKYLLHIKHYKKNVGNQELQRLGSTAVLAFLSIPSNSDEKKFDIYGSEVESILENQKKMTNLLGHPNIPTRESLKYIITHRDILEKSSDTCQELFNLVESDFLPLKLCFQCQPLLSAIECTHNAQYIAPIKKIIFHKLLTQVSKVFTSVTIDYFTTRICPKEFYAWEDAEFLIVNLVSQGHLKTLLDYEKKAIYFGSATIDPVLTMRHELSNLGKSLVKVVTMVYPGHIPKESMDKRLFFKNISNELENEHQRILKRKEENDKRRSEKIREQEQFEEKKKQELLKQMKKEEEKKQQKEQEELQILERERLQKQMDKQKYGIAVQLLEDIARLRPNLMISGKLLSEYRPADILNAKFEVNDIEKAYEEQFLKERSEKIKLKRLDAKKMDHLHRAIRQEELANLNKWKEDTLEKDRQELEKLQSVREIEYKKAYEESLKSKALLKGVSDEANEWINKQMVERYHAHEIALKEQIARLTELLKTKKIQRARDRFKKAEQEKKDAEFRKKKLEEEQNKLAEQERQRKLDEVARIQRQRDEEIELQMKARGEMHESQQYPHPPSVRAVNMHTSYHGHSSIHVNGNENGETPSGPERFTPEIVRKNKELQQSGGAHSSNRTTHIGDKKASDGFLSRKSNIRRSSEVLNHNFKRTSEY